MKKHICNKEKTVEVEGYIAIRENKVVYVEPHKRCRPTNRSRLCWESHLEDATLLI